MGMFDKDKMYSGKRLDLEFQQDEEFVLYDVPAIINDVPTDVGMARKTILTVATMASPKEAFFVGTMASAVADKAEQAEASDFPAVVLWTKVHSEAFNTEALVLSFVRRYDGEALSPEEVKALKATAPGVEDVPFDGNSDAKTDSKAAAKS